MRGLAAGVYCCARLSNVRSADGPRSPLIKTIAHLCDDLLAAAKARAALDRTTLTRLVEEGLSLRLRGPVLAKRRLEPLPVSPRSGGLLPGIDPLGNHSLLDAADET